MDVNKTLTNWLNELNNFEKVIKNLMGNLQDAGFKELSDEEDNDKAVKQFIIIEAVYYVVSFVLSSKLL